MFLKIGHPYARRRVRGGRLHEAARPRATWWIGCHNFFCRQGIPIPGGKRGVRAAQGCETGSYSYMVGRVRRMGMQQPHKTL